MKNSKPPGDPACHLVRGFTLIELLISATVSSLLLILLVQVLVTTQDLWLKLRKKTNASQECRAVMSVIQADLRAMFKEGDRKRGIVPFYTIPSTTGGGPEISFLAVADLLTQDPSTAQATAPKSDLCIVTYRMSPGRLTRLLSNSDDTYPVIKTRVNGFIDAVLPNAPDQVPSKPELADQPWCRADVVVTPNTAPGLPVSTSETISPYVVAFDAVPYRLRRPMASPTGPPMAPNELQQILAGRIAGTATNQWPMPYTFPEHSGALPKEATYDPDYSAPDVIVVRIVVAQKEYLEAKSFNQPMLDQLASNAQKDIKDGKLDGMDGTDHVLTPEELAGLSFATTSIVINQP